MGEIDKGAILSAAAALVAVVALAAGGIEARAEETPGKRLYLKYCSACHGSEGKGDGVVSQLMRPKPTDLTQVAKQHGGEFPTLSMMQVIDGTKSVRAHGDPDMPVWGEVLKSQVGDTLSAPAGTRGVVMGITDYLRSIQSTSSPASKRNVPREP